MSGRRRIPVLLALVLPAAPAVSEAGPGDERVALAARTHEPIRIDGVLSEPAWGKAQLSRRFTQRDPHDGEPAMFPTEFSVLYDDEAVVFGIRAYDPQPERIAALLTRRDQQSASDWVWVAIDSYHDRRTAFVFGLNPAGVQRDLLVYDDKLEDENWDAVWEGAASRDAEGWVAELRIPLGQLRFSEAEEQVWGLQVSRRVQRSQEESYWVPWPMSSAGRVTLYGTLTGLADVEPRRRLEVVPYALVGTTVRPGAADPLGNTLGIGADASLGLTSNLTLSGTVLPDFGQVEADASSVNLTDVPTFFPEKRPFFLEGVDIFRFGIAQSDDPDEAEELFYTRRIGARPRARPDGLELEGAPAFATIYGAAKLSGKTAAGWSVGVLDAVTAEEHGWAPDTGSGAEELVAEPLTNYSVLSLRKDFRDGRTSAAMVATGVQRRLEGTGIDWLHEQAWAGGLSLDNRFGEGDAWFAGLKLMGSSVHGSPEAIDRTQRDAQHYFQRPDADHLDHDPRRTHLAGGSAQYLVGRVGGDWFRGGVGGDVRTPGFEVDDLGYQRAADYALQWLWLQARDDRSGPVLRDWQVNAATLAKVDCGGLPMEVTGNVNAQARLRSFWWGLVGGGYTHELWRPGALRGGPALRGVPHGFAYAMLRSDPRRDVAGNLTGLSLLPDEGDSWLTHVSAELTLQLASNLALEVGPFHSRTVDDLQYLGELTDGRPEPEYLLARVDHTSLGLTLRLNYTLSTVLSLEVYAQPFVSTGAFSSYRLATDPGADTYAARFSPPRASDELPRPDFDTRELRSNVVLRWEYLPGSTLFVVWSHARTSQGTEGALDLGSDLAALADEPGEHMLMLKLAYWLGS